VSDIGKNLDINPGFGAGKSSNVNPLKKPEVDSKTSSDNSNSQISIENKGVYKNPSISQAQLGYEAQERLVSQLPIRADNSKLEKHNVKSNSLDLPKDYEIKAKNPVLAAKLKNPQKIYHKSNNPKKSPPEPSLQVLYNPRKGTSINPRKVKPSIPSRLQALIDDPRKPIDILNEALDDTFNSNLANIYAKKLIKNEELIECESLSETFNLDEDMIELTKNKFLIQLKELLEESQPDSPHRVIIESIIQGLESRADSNFLVYLLQFFLPSPFPYIFVDLDDEFYEDEEELKHDFQENDSDDNSQENDENNNDDEENSLDDCACSISIKTKNYNKIHFYVKYTAFNNSVRVLIKGDSSASEIIIPVESEIEEIFFDRIESINYEVSTWKETILRLSENKVLKTKLEGNLNPTMLKVCNAILLGINRNDINLYEDNSEIF
jgi:hypothetical protein